MKNNITRWLCLVAVLITAMGLFAARPGAAQGTCRTFTETGFTVCDKFLAYWDANGGLAQQGFPLTESRSEVSKTDGKTYTVQYFERAVFELHPEFAGTENEVLLQLLGVFFYQQRYPSGAPGQTANAEAGARLFPETGYTVGGTFQRYWETHGGLRQQGFPISNEFMEVNALDGKPYKVQYFERAVFEYHPEFAGTPNEVLLSQLGTFALQTMNMPTATVPAPTAQATVTRPAAQPSATTPPAQPTSTTAPAQPTATTPPAAPTNTTAPAGGCSDMPPANPDILTIPESRCGPAGTVFGFTGRGFQGGESVGVYITAPDQSVFGPQFQLDTDGDGYIINGVSLSTTANFPKGRWAITFEGVQSRVVKIEYFIITP